MTGVNTRENSFKEGVQMGLKHTRTRKKYTVFFDPHDPSVKGKCSGCKRPVVVLRPDIGETAKERRPLVGLYCQHCEVIFPNYRKVCSIYERD